MKKQRALVRRRGLREPVPLPSPTLYASLPPPTPSPFLTPLAILRASMRCLLSSLSLYYIFMRGWFRLDLGLLVSGFSFYFHTPHWRDSGYPCTCSLASEHSCIQRADSRGLCEHVCLHGLGFYNDVCTWLEYAILNEGGRQERRFIKRAVPLLFIKRPYMYNPIRASEDISVHIV